MNVDELKRVKNRVIGNPDSKRAYSAQPGFIPALVDALSRPDLRIDAAHILASISYGDHNTLASLLHADTLRALLFAISDTQDAPALRAFSRALRSIAQAVADVVGPSRWGLGKELADMDEARVVLDSLFHIDSLDVFLPLLVEKHTSIYIAELVATSIRSQEHRSAVTEWMPPGERMTQIKSRRGWEKSTETTVNGGWVVRNLCALLSTSKDVKLQEAVLLALAALTKDNPPVSRVLIYEGTLSLTLDLCKSRNFDVQLAACLCATHTIRATPSHSCSECDLAARSIVNVINRFISDDHSSKNKNKACFILYYLVNDDPQLAQMAFDRTCLSKLCDLLQSITPTTEQPDDLDMEEPASTLALREAALTAIASIALFENNIRRNLTDEHHLLPLISASLASPHVGVKYGACQCVRALSRSVAVLRTSVVDSGLGLKIFELFKSESEDRRVVGAAVKAVCNIICEFSPLKPIYLDQGLMPRLVQLISSPDPSLRLNALWAVKNLVRKTSTETKKDVMRHLGWGRLVELLGDSDEEIVEQTLNILRNLAENEEGIGMLFKEIGADRLLSILVGFLSQPAGVPSSPTSSSIPIPASSTSIPVPPPLSISTSFSSSPSSSPSHDILLQTSFTLANLSNGSSTYQSSIISYPTLLPALRQTLAEGNTEVRRPIIRMILELVKSHPRWRREVINGGLVGTLKGLVGGKHHGPPGSPTSPSMGMGMSISPTNTTNMGIHALGHASLGAGGRSPSWHAHGGGHGHAQSFGGRSLSHSTSTSALGLVGITGAMSMGLGLSGGASGASTGGGHSCSISVSHPNSHRSHAQAHAPGTQAISEDDKDVIEDARQALDWLEHGDVYSSMNTGPG
ncbi:hypothetical protein VKT23_000551 [Stygiomarasmius scandens]|uniref:Armadillo repeat-containing protein 8 n=1 Tax=Marasmiellus scandens TaxID=2682957 RepID=A0ABR1K4F7_9AGAR